MANALYGIAREKFLLKQWDWVADDFGLLLVDDIYEPDLDLDQLVSHIPEATVAAEGDNYIGGAKSGTLGYAVGGGVAFSGVEHERIIQAVVMFREGSPRYLVAYMDDVPTLPFLVAEPFGITVRPGSLDDFRWFRL